MAERYGTVRKYGTVTLKFYSKGTERRYSALQKIKNISTLVRYG